MPSVEFKDLDIVFGANQRRALALLDSGKDRGEILTETGCVLGAAGINLAIETGETCVLMGLSGSGKSTVVRSVNGLNRVTRGQVLIDHERRRIDVASCSADELRMLRTRRVAMVFQQFGLLPWRTVRENVGLGLELRGTSRAEIDRKVEAKLDLVGLSQWSDKFAHELSGGMQQRVGLARAFATDADILLMDEPFSALDPLIRTKLQDELLMLQRELKKTIVFVSHDLDEALKLGTRIAILESGRIVQCGTGEDILINPANDYVAEFVQHMNPLNVIRGRSMMTPGAKLQRNGSTVFLDEAKLLRVDLDAEGRPAGVTLDGRRGQMAHTDGELGQDGQAGLEAMRAADVIVAPVDLKMRAAIELRRSTGNPIVLVDQLGRLAGLCGEEEIYRALLKRPR